MTRCLRCEAALDLGDDLQEGQTVVCEECSAEMEVVSTTPIQLFLISEEGDDDEFDEFDDDDFDDDDDLDGDDDEEEFPAESPY
jgi:alpha-aminoadipate/glutamate carrier protein LysW